MICLRVTRRTLAVPALMALAVGLAAGQQPAGPISGTPGSVASSIGGRESLDEAWWTGPLLAPSANTLPRSHILIEPYLYDVIAQGFYDASGARHSGPHANEFGSLTYINYGLANRLTIGLIPVFGYNQVSQGLNSTGVEVGDLTVQAQYRLRLFHEGSWLPTTSIAVQETLPTGRYDQLGTRPNDGLGSGAYTTTLCFYTQTFFWMPKGRILRTRFNVTQAFSRSVSVEDVSVYGTSEGFRGHANPGAALFVDAAWEYSVTRHWVLALDATYRHQYDTRVSGYSNSDLTLPIQLNSGTSQAFALAPAFEYNFNSRVGVILGTRLFPAGKNTTNSVTPVIAVNIVH